MSSKYQQTQLSDTVFQPDLDFRNKKVLISTDWMYAPGGADKVVRHLTELFPNSEILTAVYFPERYSGQWKPRVPVLTTGLQKFPFIRIFHRYLSMFAHWGFESFDTSDYDLVISVSAGAAKRLVTDYKTPHIGIILTPPRFLWDKELGIRKSWLAKIAKPFVMRARHNGRLHDFMWAQKLDKVIAISQYIADKVEKYYRRDVDAVIYPGVDLPEYEEGKRIVTVTPDAKLFSSEVGTIPEKYFLVVARHYKYKNIDMAIQAAQVADVNLLIAGTGPDTKYLKRLAKGNDKIRFLGYVSDDALDMLYRHAQALIFPAVEDFGLVVVESLARGCPAIVNMEGGAKEILSDEFTHKAPSQGRQSSARSDPLKLETGYVFETQDELNEILSNFSRDDFKTATLLERSRVFGSGRFKEGVNTTCEINPTL